MILEENIMFTFAMQGGVLKGTHFYLLANQTMGVIF